MLELGGQGTWAGLCVVTGTLWVELRREEDGNPLCRFHETPHQQEWI